MLLPAVFLCLFTGILASLPTPAPAALQNVRVATAPLVTPAPHKNLKRVYNNRRDIISDIESDAEGILSDIGSDLPSFVISGIDNYFQNFPSGSQVESSLGLSPSQLATVPTSVLNLGPYGNWTTKGWNVRLHGNVYKQPVIATSKLNDLANDFLIGTSIQQLPPAQASQARNVTHEIFVVQIADVQPTFYMEAAPSGGTATVQVSHDEVLEMCSRAASLTCSSTGSHLPD